MKKIFKIDWITLVCFVAAAVSGLYFFCACGHGGGGGRGVCCEFGYMHEVPALLFVFFSLWHIQMHWVWYKGLLKNGIRGNKIVTFLLTLAFLAVAVSGFMLLFGGCRQGEVRSWHSWSSLCLAILALIHLVQRFPLLMKSFRK